jgi:hypothetical protein
VHVLAAGAAPGLERRSYGMVQWLGGEEQSGWPGALVRLRRAPWHAPAAIAAVALRLRLALGRLGPIDEVHSHWLVPTAWPLLPPLGAAQLAHAHGADVRLLTTLPAPVRVAVTGRLLARASVICTLRRARPPPR